jgi:hypothetical protein
MNFENMDWDTFEDFLIDMGFIHSGSSKLTDAEDRTEQLEAMVMILCRRVVVMEDVIKYAIQSRIGGYEQEPGKRMELYITGEPIEPKPTMFDRIEEIIKQETEVDNDQPWLN